MASGMTSCGPPLISFFRRHRLAQEVLFAIRLDTFNQPFLFEMRRFVTFNAELARPGCTHRRRNEYFENWENLSGHVAISVRGGASGFLTYQAVPTFVPTGNPCRMRLSAVRSEPKLAGTVSCRNSRYFSATVVKC